jgi:hypothetical protein
MTSELIHVVISERDRDTLTRLGAEIDPADSQSDAQLSRLIYHPGRQASVEYLFDRNVCAPLKGTYSVAMPGSVFDHYEIFCRGVNLERLLKSELMRVIRRPILVSAIPEVSVRIRLQNINYETFTFIDNGYMTTPFAIVDESSDVCFVFDCDLQYSFLSCSKKSLVSGTIFEDLQFWNDCFESNFTKLFPPSQRNLALFDQYVRPTLTYSETKL